MKRLWMYLGLLGGIGGAVWARGQEPVRNRPEEIPLTAEERETAAFWSLRIEDGKGGTFLGAFLPEEKGQPAGEMVFRVPGHATLDTAQRIRAERRRRDDPGPSFFRPAVTLPWSGAGEPGLLEFVEIEKRPGQGRLQVTLRLSCGVGSVAPSLLARGTLRQTSGDSRVIAQLRVPDTGQPTLAIRSLQGGRFLYASLRLGDWDVVLPDRRPGIPVVVKNARGIVVESTILRPTEDPAERVYNWVAELRKPRPGETYTVRVAIAPGPGFPELAEELTIRMPDALPRR
ncbi:MAG: hypothetical protein U1E27_03565 [Kiritimatiellia bacterium]|nr:hypothetical protein [Kiritimatiellia bacterium]